MTDINVDELIAEARWVADEHEGAEWEPDAIAMIHRLADALEAFKPGPADSLRAVRAEAWDEGAKWAAVECGAIRREADGFLAPGDNPYREGVS